jgi:excinuclease ABC subunit C
MRRRFRQPAANEEGAVEELRWRMPDLVVVDGGKGQLAAAVEAAAGAGVDDVPFVGLAKEREELFLPGRDDPVLLSTTSPALYLVQRLRDEAHRFAITYHRDLRAKRAVRSALDEIPGVGPSRKRALLRAFGSVRRIREAPLDEIAAVPGIGPALAARILSTLAD